MRYRETEPLNEGDVVVMHTCVEARNPKNHGKLWTCRTDQFTRGKGVYEQDSIFLHGFSGSFAPEFLQKVDVSEYTDEIDRLRKALEEANKKIDDLKPKFMGQLPSALRWYNEEPAKGEDERE
ncbi:hypothetical protein BK126_04560 [Paenibacillus sp. FSL H7-0326]|uniref:hypothetical protein n=1 Tax=Paenibacillus sp. FSL H7-0326 TaxID=1921144 RepID=UPI00096D0BA2|nr:hypothetical protein [Paenibacillus sp. FSL H7-0326]OMC71375.1 hypothetical protein BK126_04560 [Paenibacillus sp. FSL H7-0326]